MHWKFDIKLLLVSTIALAGILTAALCITQPKMHKPFQLSIIEYIIKINTDGSVTSTKSVTTHTIKEGNK